MPLLNSLHGCLKKYKRYRNPDFKALLDEMVAGFMVVTFQDKGFINAAEVFSEYFTPCAFDKG